MAVETHPRLVEEGHRGMRSEEATTYITDPPDPNCPHCKGRGTIGGCRDAERCKREKHIHTFSFCPCVSERVKGTEE